MSILLGIDLGDRGIGVARGDTVSGAVAPLTTLRRRSATRDAAALDRLCEEHGAAAIVVGLPLNLDGSESQQSRRTRDWVAEVHPMLSVPVTFRDERHSSASAERRMGRAPRGRSGGPPSASTMRRWRARIDREAAAEIVQNELDAREAAADGVEA